MKRTTISMIVILISIFLINARQSDSGIKENLTTLILVRHAEKVLDNSEDPALTVNGKKRAQELAYILAHIPIDLIYSTPYKRTKATVAPIAKNKNLTLNSYIPMRELDFLTEILKLHRGKTILVCGHSNTVPSMVSILTGEKKAILIRDHVYDNLFILQVRTMGDALLTRLRFGAHTPEKSR